MTAIRVVSLPPYTLALFETGAWLARALEERLGLAHGSVTVTWTAEPETPESVPGAETGRLLVAELRKWALEVFDPSTAIDSDGNDQSTAAALESAADLVAQRFKISK